MGLEPQCSSSVQLLGGSEGPKKDPRPSCLPESDQWLNGRRRWGRGKGCGQARNIQPQLRRLLTLLVLNCRCCRYFLWKYLSSGIALQLVPKVLQPAPGSVMQWGCSQMATHTHTHTMISLVKNRCFLSTNSYHARRLNGYLMSLKKKDCLFLCKDRIGNERIAKTG